MQAVPQKEFLQCASKEHMMIAENVFPPVEYMILSQLKLFMYRWMSILYAYSTRDIHIVAYCMQVASKTTMLSLREFSLQNGN